jgi:exopolysaccharide biosynthesis polyprenyl glycosylphosphotransferase
MLVIGAGREAEAFADEVERHPALGIQVIGHLSVDGEAVQAKRPVIGALDEITDAFRSRVIDEVAVCLPPGAEHYLEAIVAIAADQGKTVRVPRSIEEGILVGAMREEFGGYLVHSVIHDGQRDLEMALKRVVDIAGAVVALVVLSPITAVAALAIALTDGRPIFFSQTRIGRHGRPFTLHKFRTMVPDAEQQLDGLRPHNEVTGPAFKLKDDPRVTKLGRWLRRTSVDELPQFLNVLRGEMSLVGPRPALPSEVESYDFWHRRRLSVRPGMTGLWQVEARMEPDFDNRAQLDLRYIDQWSLWMDLRILARTVPAVILRSGQ